MMDMGMEKKEPMFKCPACGEMLKVETKGEDMSEDNSSAPKKFGKSNAANMPMDHLKSKIQPTSNPPGATSPNLSSY